MKKYENHGVKRDSVSWRSHSTAFDTTKLKLKSWKKRWIADRVETETFLGRQAWPFSFLPNTPSQFCCLKGLVEGQGFLLWDFAANLELEHHPLDKNRWQNFCWPSNSTKIGGSLPFGRGMLWLRSIWADNHKFQKRKSNASVKETLKEFSFLAQTMWRSFFFLTLMSENGLLLRAVLYPDNQIYFDTWTKINTFLWAFPMTDGCISWARQA